MMRGLMCVVMVIALLASGLAAFGANPVLIGHKWDSPTTPANGETSATVITPDGRYILLRSSATDLVPVDTNGSVVDTFLYDRVADSLEMIVPTAGGVQPSEGCYGVAMSADARYIAFNTPAENLLPGVTGFLWRSYLFDRETETLELVGVADDGTPADPGGAVVASKLIGLSVDGRYACFNSYADNLAPGDTDGVADVFVRDLQAGRTERVSLDTDGSEIAIACGSRNMTPDGRYVSFTSEATDISPPDQTCRVFVRDRATDTTEAINIDSSGSVPLDERMSGAAPMSGDGRFVAFYGTHDTFAEGDTNGTGDVFLRDRVAGTTELVSYDTDGQQFSQSTYPIGISADARFVAYYWTDLSGSRSYLRDRTAQTVESPGSGGWLRGMSANGRFLLLTKHSLPSIQYNSLYLWEPELVEFGTIQGMVTESDSGEPVAGAHVWIGGTLMTVTDAEGNYSIEAAVTGDTSVKAEMEGYAEAVEEGVAVTAGGTTEVDLVLHVQPFPDVEEGSWAASSIAACVSAGIVGGYEDGLYHGDAEVTRDQMAVYIARGVAGGDESVPTGPAEATFDDVPSTGYGESGTDPHWAYKYVEYAVASSVVQGYDYDDPENPGETIYRYEPSWTVTRDQMAVYVARAMVAPTGEAALADYVPANPRDFPDVPNTGYGADGTDPFWAYTHIEYCVEHGVVSGYDDGYYRPEWVVTRDQMAVYVARAFGLGG